jgi:pimeloyl-ACP methyl ester carboxylesterase
MPEFAAEDGTRLAYSDEGAGPVVLCLAGLTRDARDFDYVLPHLAGHRVIRPDYRGRDRSAWADPATYTVPQEARDQIALLDHLGIARAAVIGTSRGGLVSMVLALTAKERLAGVCLNDIGPLLSRQGLDKIAAYIGRRPACRTHAEMAAAMPQIKPEFDGVPASRWLEEVQRHSRERPDGLDITYDPKLAETVMPMLTAPLPEDPWPGFDAFTDLPLCLIRGGNSDLLSADAAAQMRARRPDMIFAEVPGRGHIPFLDEPEAVAAIEAWLKLCK